MEKDETSREDNDYPVVEIEGHDDKSDEPHLSLTREEIDAVGASLVFDAILGKSSIRKALILGFTGLTACLLAVGFWASTISVSDTLVVYKQQRWIPGAPNAFRLAFIDDTEGFIPLKEARVVLEKNDGDQEAILFSGKLQPGQASSITAAVPRWSKGSYTLNIEAKTLRRKKRAEIAVELDPQFEGSQYVSSDTSEKLRSFPGDFAFHDPGHGITIELLPESYILGSSLHNLVYVRTTDGHGRPVGTRVHLELANGYIHGDIPSTLETDATGLATFMVYPTFNILAFGVSAENAAGETGSRGIIHLPVEPRIVRIRAKNSHVPADGRLCIRAYTVSKSSPFYLDVYRKGIWLHASSGYLNSFSTEIEIEVPKTPGLATVQGYGSPAMVGKAISAIHVWVQKEKEALSESISSVARILSSLRIDRDYAQAVCSEEILEGNCNRGRLMAFLLSRFDTGHYEPRIHYTTRDDDQKRSALLRQKIKRIVVVSLSCAAAIFSLAVVFAVFLALRKRPMIVEEAVRAGKEERKKMEEIEDWRGKKVLVEESPGLDELESRQSLLHTGWGQHSGMGTRRFFVQIAMLAAVTAALFGLLAVLITYMRWTFEI